MESLVSLHVFLQTCVMLETSGFRCDDCTQFSREELLDFCSVDASSCLLAADIIMKRRSESARWKELRALSQEKSDLKVALNKEKEKRKQESIAQERKTGSKIVNEREKIEDELNSIKEDIMSMRTGSGWALSSAASTGYGLRLGTFAQPPSFAAGWQIEWVPRKIGIKKWTTGWSTEDVQGIQDGGHRLCYGLRGQGKD